MIREIGGSRNIVARAIAKRRAAGKPLCVIDMSGGPRIPSGL